MPALLAKDASACDRGWAVPTSPVEFGKPSVNKTIALVAPGLPRLRAALPLGVVVGSVLFDPSCIARARSRESLMLVPPSAMTLWNVVAVLVQSAPSTLVIGGLVPPL